MTKKDYIQFAKMFRDERVAIEICGALRPSEAAASAMLVLDKIVKRTCDIFAEDNPRFERDKFLSAYYSE